MSVEWIAAPAAGPSLNPTEVPATHPATADRPIGEALVDHIRRVEESRFEALGQPARFEPASGVSAVLPGPAESVPSVDPAQQPETVREFERHADLLRSSFSQAIEMELVAKIGMQFANSTQKLMSG